MTPYNIIVSSFESGMAPVEAMKDQLMSTWRGATGLHIDIHGAEELEETDLRGVDAIVLLIDPAKAGGRALPVLATLEEAGVAVVAMLPHEIKENDRHNFPGALVESIDADPGVFIAKFEGILHRQNEVSRLRKEVAIAHRFHGGLKGEIARMHEEMQLAAMVQREFLPRELPALFGFEFGALWRPANYVSGDIYDVSRLDDDHVGVFIADAVGHGVPAALMTMVISRSLRTKIISGTSYRLVEPTEVLDQLNRDLIRRQGRTTRFATAVYAIINCRSRVVRLAGAGHPPPLLMRASGGCEELETSGGLLGVFDDEQYEQIEFDLAVNDRMLLYSDGFEQAFPATPADAYERRLPNTQYRSEFDALCQEATPHSMIERITQRLDDQRGSLHQVDDLTLVTLKAGPINADATQRSSTTASDTAPQTR